MDQNIKIVAREQLRYSFYRCLPNEPTNADFEQFLSGSTEGPLRSTQSWEMSNFYGRVSGWPVVFSTLGLVILGVM